MTTAPFVIRAVLESWSDEENVSRVLLGMRYSTGYVDLSVEAHCRTRLRSAAESVS